MVAEVGQQLRFLESLSRQVTCRKAGLLANRENHVTHYEFTSYFLSFRPDNCFILRSQTWGFALSSV
jgi:hypothetical protein